MSRNISAQMQAVSTADVVRPLMFVEADFDTEDGGTLNFWSGYGQINYGGKLYVGAGNLLSIGTIAESTDLTASGARVVLSGIVEPLISKARDADYQGRQLVIKLGAMDDQGEIIASPVEIFSGFMDVMTISDSGETASIGVAVENRMIEFDRTRVRRFTAEDQKIDYPNDKGLEYVAEIQEKSIVWGDKKANPIKYDNGGYSSPYRFDFGY